MAVINVTVKRFWHMHLLQIIERGVIFSNCLKCSEPLKRMCYFCNTCNRGWHVECIPGPQDIDHPCHPSHPLELLRDEELPPHGIAHWKCSLCEKPFSDYIYHCQVCDFSVDQSCVTNPPPLKIKRPKCHKEHEVTFMTRHESFVCNACGTQGDRNSYVCITCSLMFHTNCVDLPRVIKINRHEHRIFHTYSLVRGDCWKCGICHQEVNWRYGAYSCETCPSFAVFHSLCATREDVWDGIDLEGVPEEIVEIPPYIVIEDGVTNHFSHKEHNLRLVVTHSSVRWCESCVRPIYSQKEHYKCMECDYSLHESCANIPLQGRNKISLRPFFLVTNKGNDYFFCDACERVSNGFRYEGDGFTLDTMCASDSLSNVFGLHEHPLFLATMEGDICFGCNNAGDLVIRCDYCQFSVDFKCATLPEEIRHKCDDRHFLFLRPGVFATGKYWCEICETLLDPKKWFYSCEDCGIVCHIECVVGDFLNLKPGLLNVNDKGRKLQVVPNALSTRPICGSCGSRCRPSLFFQMLYVGRNQGSFC